MIEHRCLERIVLVPGIGVDCVHVRSMDPTTIGVRRRPASPLGRKSGRARREVTIFVGRFRQLIIP